MKLLPSSAVGRAWQGGTCVAGVSCMAGGGMCVCVGGGVWLCMAGETATAADGTHPTGMHFCSNFVQCVALFTMHHLSNICSECIFP